MSLCISVGPDGTGAPRHYSFYFTQPQLEIVREHIDSMVFSWYGKWMCCQVVFTLLCL